MPLDRWWKIAPVYSFTNIQSEKLGCNGDRCSQVYSLKITNFTVLFVLKKFRIC